MKGVGQLEISSVQRAMSGGIEDSLARLADRAEKGNLNTDEVSKIREQADQFEAMIIKVMLDSMRKTINEGDLFGDPNSPSKQIYQSMLDAEYAQSMAKTHTFGLSDAVMQQFGVSESEYKVATPGAELNFAGIMSSKGLESLSFSDPIKGRISSHFGIRMHPISGKMAMHEGVDIAVPIGTPVKSTLRGEVVFAGEQKGYGKVVIIEHKNGIKSLYAHLDEINVKEGQFVGRGREIALSGSSGRSTGPHLHFEIQQDGRPINPMKFVDFR